MGAGAGLGESSGGWFNGIWGWKWAVLIQLPFVAIGTILVFFVVQIPLNPTSKAALRRVDYLGSSTLTAAVVLLLFGLNAGGNYLPWTHPVVLVTLPLSAIFLLLFIYVEERVALEPIIPLRLLLNRTVASACLTYRFAYMASFGVMFYVPIYLQLLGSSPTQAGLRFIPQSASTAIGALGTGIIIRASGNYIYLNMASHALLVSAYALIATFSENTPPWCPFLALGALGLGFGGMLVTTLIALISSVAHEHQAAITSASFAFRSTGSTIGLTIASAVFQNLLRLSLWDILGKHSDADHIIGRIRENFDELKHLDAEMRSKVQDSYLIAPRGVFMVILGFSVLAALSSLAMRQNLLYTNLARS